MVLFGNMNRHVFMVAKKKYHSSTQFNKGTNYFMSDREGGRVQLGNFREPYEYHKILSGNCTTTNKI